MATERKELIENGISPIYNQMRGFIAETSIFSHDSSLLFLYSSNNVYVHSVETGECICSLKGHKSNVVSLIIDPSNHLRLISLDEHGIIKIWDYLRSKCIDTINLPSILQQKEIDVTFSSLTGCQTKTQFQQFQYIYCVVNNDHIISIDIKTKKIHPIVYGVSRV